MREHSLDGNAVRRATGVAVVGAAVGLFGGAVSGAAVGVAGFAAYHILLRLTAAAAPSDDSLGVLFSVVAGFATGAMTGVPTGALTGFVVGAAAGAWEWDGAVAGAFWGAAIGAAAGLAAGFAVVALDLLLGTRGVHIPVLFYAAYHSLAVGLAFCAAAGAAVGVCAGAWIARRR